jgi:hypothetical protein
MRRIKLLAILALMFSGMSLSVMNARGQAAPPQFSWVCFAGNNQPNVYVSGVMQGPANAGASFQSGFAQALMQQYSFQGAVACRPSQNANLAQNSLNGYRVAWRNAKKNVIDTGWTEAAPAAPGTASATAPGEAPGTAAATNVLGSILKPKTPAAPASPEPPVAVGSGHPANTGAGGGAGTPSAPQGGAGTSASSVLGMLFGTPAPATSGSGAATAGKTPAAAGKTGSGTSGTGGGGANAGAVTQVTSTLSNLFGNRGSSGAAPGGAGNSAKPGAPAANGAGGVPAGASTPNANVPGGLPLGALGSAQYQSTMLVIYGCGRQGTDGTQVLCVADLTNQNAKDTLVQNANVWKDAFIVDDRGDRHTRTAGYFLNIDGEQRQQLDIDNGKSAHFILGFDGVPAKVEKITLRSATGGLDVNGISLIAVGAADASGPAQPSSAPVAPAPAPGQGLPGATRR